MTDLWPLFILTEIGYSLIGSPCWQNFLWLRGCTRMVPCCGTVLLYSPSPASYAHSMSSLSLWRRHWWKGLTCDSGWWWWRQRSVLAPLRITKSSFLLLEKKENLVLATLFKKERLWTDWNHWKRLLQTFSLFASGNRLNFPLYVCLYCENSISLRWNTESLCLTSTVDIYHKFQSQASPALLLLLYCLHFNLN